MFILNFMISSAFGVLDSLCQEYDENRALALETRQAGAANGSTTGKAKICGYNKGEAKVEVNIKQNSVQLGWPPLRGPG